MIIPANLQNKRKVVSCCVSVQEALNFEVTWKGSVKRTRGGSGAQNSNVSMFRPSHHAVRLDGFRV